MSVDDLLTEVVMAAIDGLDFGFGDHDCLPCVLRKLFVGGKT